MEQKDDVLTIGIDEIFGSNTNIELVPVDDIPNELKEALDKENTQNIKEI